MGIDKSNCSNEERKTEEKEESENRERERERDFSRDKEKEGGRKKGGKVLAGGVHYRDV